MEITNNIEEQIIFQFEENYSKGYSMLFSYFFTPMRRVASRYVGDECATDVVHDIFLNIWKTKYKSNSAGALKSYLFSAVHNKCLNEIRKNKNGEKYIQALPKEPFEESVMDEDLFLQLLDAIEVLPANYKKVIELSLNGKTLLEIAVVMNTTVDAVKNYKQRAKIILRKHTGKIYIIIFF